MKDFEKKFKHRLSTAELGNYLRQLANAVEGQAVENYNDLQDCLNNYLKFDLKIKREKEAVIVKLKVKSPGMPPAHHAPGDTAAAQNAKPKYKTLKKKMKSDFEAISESISQAEFPDALIVKSFLTNAELMISYPGYGDEYYDAFREALVHFAKTFENRDQAFIKQSYERLKQLRDECHKRYK